MRIISEPIKKRRADKNCNELEVKMSDGSVWWLSDLAHLKRIKLAKLHSRAAIHSWLWEDLFSAEPQGKELQTQCNEEWQKLGSRPRNKNLDKIVIGSKELEWLLSL